MRHLPLIALTIASLLGAGPAAHGDLNLPSMGEPADQAMSPRDEARIGRRLMAEAEQAMHVNRDPQVTAYIEELGQRLAAGTDPQPIDGYTFFVIHEDRINAFAAPGGYIGIYTGLMLEADNESQLAGVMAHEIAHISQRHIARSIVAEQDATPATIAQLVAGILLSGINPQAGQAAIMTGVAGQAQRRINYSRSVESEADRIGIRILAEAGYHPEGMAEFFDVLLRQEMGAIDAAPEYLRTHPLSTDRIAEASGRARDLAREHMRRDRLSFQLMRKRLQVADTGEPNVLIERWAEAGVSEAPHREAARQYGIALLEIELGQAAEAAERIARLRGDDRDNVHYQMAAAAAARQLGDDEEARRLYDMATELYPSYWPAAVERAEFARDRGRPELAAGQLTRFLRENSDAPASLWRELGRAREKAGDSVASREALAEWYARSYRYDQAMRQLEIGLDESEPGSNARHRIRARLQEIRSRQSGRLAEDPLSDDR